MIFDKERVNKVPQDLKPLGAWYYFWHNVLYAIPLIGTIFLIIHALGGTDNINKRSYARSFFCGLILALIVGTIVVAISIATAGWEGLVAWIQTLFAGAAGGGGAGA